MSDKSASVKTAIDLVDALDNTTSAVDMAATANKFRDCLNREDYSNILKVVGKMDSKGKGADIEVIDFDNDGKVDQLNITKGWLPPVVLMKDIKTK